MKNKSLFKKRNLTLLYTYFLSKENNEIEKFLIKPNFNSINNDWFEKFKKNKIEIYEKINNNLSNDWTIERIPLIEKSILSISIYELNYLKEEKREAIKLINKVVEFSKKYLDANKFKYIHAILDSILNNY